MKALLSLACGLVVGASVISAQGATVNLGAPAMDKWMYGNVPGTYSGQRDTAPVFATLNSSDEDRMGEFLLGFSTAGNIPTGLGAGSYLIQSITLKLTVSGHDTFFYDPTYDSYRNYLLSNNPNYVADSDAGHPIELYGVGLRNGYTELSGSISGTVDHRYHEDSPYGPAGVHTKNAYPLGFTANGTRIDVSDNVSEAFESSPWAIGLTQDVDPGDAVPSFTEFTFQLNLANPFVLAYVQEALNSGMLGLMISTLHASSGQTGPQTYPVFFTGENQIGSDVNPQLEIKYTVVPEPNASVLLIAGCALFATGRAWRNRSSLL